MNHNQKIETKTAIRQVLSKVGSHEALTIIADLMAEYEELNDDYGQPVEKGVEEALDFFWRIDRHEFYTFYWSDGIANDWMESYATEDLARERLGELKEAVMYDGTLDTHKYFGNSLDEYA